MCSVSVITIFLNGEAFIAEAIDSVLAQSFRSFELILVDDGSTDTRFGHRLPLRGNPSGPGPLHRPSTTREPRDERLARCRRPIDRGSTSTDGIDCGCASPDSGALH